MLGWYVEGEDLITPARNWSAFFIAVPSFKRDYRLRTVSIASHSLSVHVNLTFCDVDRIGLKFQLYSCEVLFNRGLCLVYMASLCSLLPFTTLYSLPSLCRAVSKMVYETGQWRWRRNTLKNTMWSTKPTSTMVLWASLLFSHSSGSKSWSLPRSCRATPFSAFQSEQFSDLQKRNSPISLNETFSAKLLSSLLPISSISTLTFNNPRKLLRQFQQIHLAQIRLNLRK